MTKRIAIDFGTERTKVAYLPGPGRSPELLRFVHEDSERSFVPSLFYLPKESDQILFGFDAEAMLEEDPIGVIDDLKRRLHEGRRRANGREATPQAMLVQLFAFLRQHAGLNIPAFDGTPPDEVVLTVPPGFGPAQRDVVKQAALEAGFGSVVDMIDEPVAAARAWLADGGDHVDHIVVLDCGGGTVDWAYLRRDETGAIRVAANCPPGGIDRLGGRDVDEGLVELVERKLADVGEDSIEFGVTRRARLRARLRRIKEAVVRGSQTQFTVRVGDRAVTLDRSEVETVAFDQFIARGADGLRAFIDRVEKAFPKQEVPRVLIVGGSGRLAGLKEAIAKSGHDVVAWDRADFASAIGALSDEVVSGAGGGRARKDHQAEKRVPGAESASPAKRLQIRRDNLPEIAPDDDSAEIAEKEAKLAFKRGKYELALLFCLIYWQRAVAIKIVPDKSVYDIIKISSMSESIVNYTAKTGNRILGLSCDSEFIIVYNKESYKEIWAYALRHYDFQHQTWIFQYEYRDLKNFILNSGIIIYNFENLPSEWYVTWINPHSSFKHGPKISGDFPRSVCLNRKNVRLLAGFEEGKVQQFDIVTGRKIAETIYAGPGNVNSVQYSGNDRFILTANDQGDVEEWDASNGDSIGRCLTHDAAVVRATYSPDDRLIIVITANGEMHFWERATGERVGTVASHFDIADVEPQSAESRFVAALGEAEITRASVKILDVLLSPVENLALTYASNGTVRLWDLDAGQFTGIELVHSADGQPLVTAAFSSDGRLIATSGSDGRVRLWDMSQGLGHSSYGQPIPGELRHEGPAKFLQFVDDDRCLVTATDTVAHRWDVSAALLDGDELVAHICYNRLKPNRTLTEDELRATLINDPPADPVAACKEILPEPPQAVDAP